MIIVMGMPGAGKSTVLSKVDLAGYKVLNYGTLMFEAAQQKFGLGNRDGMRKLGIEQQHELQKAVAHKLSQETGKVILDTHASIKTPTGYLPGLPFELLRQLKVDRLVYVKAPLGDVRKRRVNDTARSRDAESLEEIAEHERVNEALLATYSALCGAPLAIIVNADGKLDEAGKRMAAVLG